MHSWRHILLLSSAVVLMRSAPVDSPNIVDLVTEMVNIPLGDQFFWSAVSLSALHGEEDVENALRLVDPDLQVKLKKWEEKYSSLQGTTKQFFDEIFQYFTLETEYLFEATTAWNRLKARHGNMSRSDCSALYKTFPVLSSTGLCTQ